MLAEQVQAQWNLGLDPIPNLTQLLEQHNIQLLLLPLPAGVYGLTNTYFEGEAARHPKARRGHSKGKRTDKTVFVLLSRRCPTKIPRSMTKPSRCNATHHAGSSSCGNSAICPRWPEFASTAVKKSSRRRRGVGLAFIRLYFHGN